MAFGVAQATKSAKRRGQRKAATRINVHTYADGAGPVVDKDWKKERAKTLQAEVAAIEKELKDFDEKSAAAKVRQALELELRRKRLEIEQNALEM